PTTPIVSGRRAANAGAPSRKLSGWRTSRPYAAASVLIGDGVTCRPRPAGRSGRVYTATTEWPAATKASSVGAANAGVPAKTRRTGASHRQALVLFEFLADALLFQARYVIDEDFSVEMIDLVLDTRGEQAARLDVDRRPRRVERAHLDVPGAQHRLVDAGHRQAPLLHQLLAAALVDLRIDEHLQLIAALGDVDDDDALGDVDLRGGQTDAGGVVHGIGHVIDQRAHLVGHGVDRGRAPA